MKPGDKVFIADKELLTVHEGCLDQSPNGLDWLVLTPVGKQYVFRREIHSTSTAAIRRCRELCILRMRDLRAWEKRVGGK